MPAYKELDNKTRRPIYVLLLPILAFEYDKIDITGMSEFVMHTDHLILHYIAAGGN